MYRIYYNIVVYLFIYSFIRLNVNQINIILLFSIVILANSAYFKTLAKVEKYTFIHVQKNKCLKYAFIVSIKNNNV